MAVAVDALDDVAFGGFFNGAIDLGGGPLQAQPLDGFLAVYTP
jgi:hypothetical protein